MPNFNNELGLSLNVFRLREGDLDLRFSRLELNDFGQMQPVLARLHARRPQLLRISAGAIWKI